MKTKNQDKDLAPYFIKKMRFDKDFRCFKKGEIIEFKPGINLLVGDQGRGKSTVFYSIMNWQEAGIAMNYDPSSSYSFMDTETMNPRLTDAFKAHKKFERIADYDKSQLDYAINKLVGGLDEKSHGEVMLPLLLCAKEKGKTYFIDEPEAGLSIRSQYKLFNHFKKTAKHNQLFIATHSIILMQEIGEVLSLEHKKWMPAAEFIESQK